MWVPKEAIPYLIEEVAALVEEAIVQADLPDADPRTQWDPNDIIIFEGFVLTVLREKQATGFDSEEMLYKGFGFLMGLIPSLLGQKRKTMPPSHFGTLAKLFHEYQLGRALEYARRVPEDCYEENLPLLHLEFRRACAIRARGSGDGAVG